MTKVDKIIKNAAKNPKIRKRWLEGEAVALKLRVDSFLKEREDIKNEINKVLEKIKKETGGKLYPGDELYDLYEDFLYLGASMNKN